MRLGGRLQAAIEVLETIFSHHRPVTSALKDWGSSHRFAGSADRAAIGNIVYDALRMKLSHAYMMDDDCPHALAHAVLFRQWNISPDMLVQQLDGDKFAPEAISKNSISAFLERDIANADEYIQADIPSWLLQSFKGVFGDEWLKEAVALNARPSLDLRVNTLKTDKSTVLKALAKTNAVSCKLAPNGVRIKANKGPDRLPNVTADIPFAKGWFEIQDEASQLAAALVGATEGDQVLDYCAGGGGKALAISADISNKGQIHTFDKDTRRMAPMIERLRRAGTRNVQICETEDALAPLQNRCDHVLVDAPCTGAGTWRRRPDTKWRLSEKNLAERDKQQREVIAKASQYVRSGGYLTYVTCSVLPQENDTIIQDRCDHVLVDAPCTGAGTWRRRPDTKWRLSEKNLAERNKQQREVIAKASQYVRSGGYLTYVTCSVLPQENDTIIQDFLKRNDHFVSVDLSKEWQTLTGVEKAPKSSGNLGLLCTPKRTETDGFFIAKLKRV